MDRNDVIYKEFPHSFMGYDPIAVDAFLDEVIREFDRLSNTIDVLQFRLANELGVSIETEPQELPAGHGEDGPKALGSGADGESGEQAQAAPAEGEAAGAEVQS